VPAEPDGRCAWPRSPGFGRGSCLEIWRAFSHSHTAGMTRQLWPSGWTVASFVLDAAATLWTQTSDGRQVLPILSTVSAGRIAALDVHRVDITADATLRAF
jgi:hypothetical protein